MATEASPKPYAVDVLVNLMRNITRTEPVFFQRNGMFYAVTDSAFGRLNYGLSVTPRNQDAVDRWGQLPEIDVSSSMLEQTGDKIVARESEKGYIAALELDNRRDGEVFFKDILETGRKINALPRDGKIRMIDHAFSYRSHKHGYACDGTDVDMVGARVMFLDSHFDLLRKREDAFFKTVQRISAERRDQVYWPSGTEPMEGRAASIPSVWVMTPRVMLTLPRRGRLDYHDHKPIWNENTVINDEMPKWCGINTNEEDPFALSVDINKASYKVRNIADLQESTNNILGSVSQTMNGVMHSMPFIEAFLGKLNSVHNKLYAEEIKRSAQMRVKVAEHIQTRS